MPEDTNLIEVEQKLVRLIQETPDIDRKQELREQLAKIQTLKDRLIAKNLAEAGQVYEEATAALRDANASLTEALDDATKLSQTITKVAKVVETLSRVADKLLV